MRRIVIFGALAGAGVVAVRRRIKVRERLIAHCEGMFERMPDTFPPRAMMRGIEETRANTARILELLGGGEEQAETARVRGTTSLEGAHDAA